MRIREFKPHDLKGVSKLISETIAYERWNKAWAHFHKERAKLIQYTDIFKGFVGIEKNKIICFAYFTFEPKHIHLEFIVVHKNYRHKGNGAKMLDYCYNYSKKHHNALTLETWFCRKPPQNKLIKYYSKHGFKKSGIVKKVYNNYDDIHFTRK